MYVYIYIHIYTHIFICLAASASPGDPPSVRGNHSFTLLVQRTFSSKVVNSAANPID